MSISQELWLFTSHHPPTLDQLHGIAGYLTEQLADYVGQAVVCFHEHLVDRSALAYSVCPSTGIAGQLAVQWEAVVLYDVRSAGLPSINVELFLFAFGRRVKAAGGDYINLRGVPGAGGRGVLFEASWYTDEFREWDYITAPRIELYGQKLRSYG